MKISEKLYLGLLFIGGSVIAITLSSNERPTQFVTGTVGVLGAMALFLAIKRSVAGPIHSLIIAAKEFGKGNFQHRISCTRNDELGELSRAFDHMGGELDRYSKQLVKEVTERKQAEDAAGQARELLETGLQQCPSGILIADATSLAIRFVNQAAQALFSRERLLQKVHEQALAIEHLEMFFPDGAPCPLERLPLWRAVRQGETVRDEEFTIQGSAGQTRWISANASPLRDTKGKITAGILILHDVTERKQMMHKIREIAFHDPLTGLPNRLSILTSIQNSIDRQDENKYALLFMDFDRFKLINDSLGHDAGDELLRKIAERIRSTLRARDETLIPARLGGDEFVVLLDSLKCLDDAVTIAQRLLEVLSQSYEIGGQTVCSTVSIGVVTSEHSFHTATDMLRDADLAMYKSKADGKGRYTVFDSVLREEVQYRLQLENDMRAGIERGEFVLEFQPIVSLATGNIEGAEALARWQHPNLGKLSAEQFIAVAEETGLIVPIGAQIINEACRQLAQWQRALLGRRQPISVHVNISRLQLLLPELIDVVERALREHCVAPECLHLEVTESIIMDNPEKVIARLQALRGMGVRINMDDFGKGYSSLSCLHEFPIDYLKLDRSFITNVKDAPELTALLTAVLTLAAELQLNVIAEGIEDSGQVAKLTALGCEFGQGYLFSRPLTSEDILGLLNSELQNLQHDHHHQPALHVGLC